MTVPMGAGLRTYRQKALVRVIGWLARRVATPQPLHDPIAIMLRDINAEFYAWAIVMGERQRKRLKATDMEFHDEEWLGAMKGVFALVENIVEDGAYPRGLVYEYFNHVWCYFLDREVANAGNIDAPENAPAVLRWVSERGYWVMRTTRMEAVSRGRMATYIKGRRRIIGSPAPNMVPIIKEEEL